MTQPHNNEHLYFPPRFLWGTATAAHQVEGNNTRNDWWRFEQRPGAIWHNDRSGIACNWWENAERDFDLMAQMGHNTHRLSIEWSRIEPEQGVWDPSAIARYREMLSGLRQRGMEPMVTLHHFTTPLWLARDGGWENPAAVTYFRRFARYAIEQLGDLVTLWCTINEPGVYAVLGYLFGEHAPGTKSFPRSMKVLRHMLRAHASAYRVIHAVDGNAQVGLVKNVPIFEALKPTDGASNRLARLLDYAFNQVVFQALDDGKMRIPLGPGLGTHGPLVDSLDFIGINYYTRDRVSLQPGSDHRFRLLQPTPGAEISDFGRNGTYGEVYPAGMYHVLKRASRLGKPIYVTENGLPDADDDQRPRFLISHLAQVQRAIAEGIDVRGYYHWSFVDNFEWAEGWDLRFGLMALNRETQARSPRPSAQIYADIIRENALRREIIQIYAPEILDGLTGRLDPPG